MRASSIGGLSPQHDPAQEARLENRRRQMRLAFQNAEEAHGVGSGYAKRTSNRLPSSLLADVLCSHGFPPNAREKMRELLELCSSDAADGGDGISEEEFMIVWGELDYRLAVARDRSVRLFVGSGFECCVPACLRIYYRTARFARTSEQKSGWRARAAPPVHAAMRVFRAADRSIATTPTVAAVASSRCPPGCCSICSPTRRSARARSTHATRRCRATTSRTTACRRAAAASRPAGRCVMSTDVRDRGASRGTLLHHQRATAERTHARAVCSKVFNHKHRWTNKNVCCAVWANIGWSVFDRRRYRYMALATFATIISIAFTTCVRDRTTTAAAAVARASECSKDPRRRRR
jgi:hypothetical protein